MKLKNRKNKKIDIILTIWFKIIIRILIIKKMISFGKLLFLGIVLVIVSSVRIDEKFITFNTSASKYVVSTSISTTFDK